MVDCVNCSLDCMKSECICKLPIFIWDHIQLSCCSKSLYHVVCITGQSKCIYCKKEFNQKMMKAIKKAENKILDECETSESRTKKLSSFRKQVNTNVYEIMLSRIKNQLKQSMTT